MLECMSIKGMTYSMSNNDKLLRCIYTAAQAAFKTVLICLDCRQKGKTLSSHTTQDLLLYFLSVRANLSIRNQLQPRPPSDCLLLLTTKHRWISLPIVGNCPTILWLSYKHTHAIDNGKFHLQAESTFGAFQNPWGFYSMITSINILFSYPIAQVLPCQTVQKTQDTWRAWPTPKPHLYFSE